MKIIILSIGLAVLASGFAVMLSYAFGARGETLGVITVVTLLVSCTTASVASSIAVRLGRKGN
jgi:hypothetical protein